MKKHNFSSLRRLLCWKQDYFGMLFGMGKQSISRFETGARKETLVHNEMLSFVSYLDEKRLLGEYVYWRFGIRISKRFYKYSTPLDNRIYIFKKLGNSRKKSVKMIKNNI
jgi:DNA-binding XRE family transcriptional regulator